MASTWLKLKPVEWSLEVRSGLEIYNSGRYLEAACKVGDADLALSNQDTFSNRLVVIGFLQGTPTEANEQPLQGGVGRMFYTEGLIHGWYFSTSDSFSAIWDQVSVRSYADCMIEFHISPVKDRFNEPYVWDVNQHLLIKAASVKFKHAMPAAAADEPIKRKGFFG